MKEFRPCSVPLFTVDPFFSIWSEGDRLYDQVTKHWTGRRNPVTCGVFIDGRLYKLMGEFACDSDRRKSAFERFIPQKSLKILPTRTIYEFEDEVIYVKLTFTSPLLIDNPEIASRPVSYLEYEMQLKDSASHTAEFYFDISAECAVNAYNGRVIARKNENSVSFGNAVQNLFGTIKDPMTVDWGYIHLADSEAVLIEGLPKRWCQFRELSFDTEYGAFEEYPYIMLRKKEQSGVIMLGYDDIKACEYFGEKTDGYYKKYFDSFDGMLALAVSDYEKVKGLCVEFDEKLIKEASKIGEEYEKITSLAYRQVMAAHKLVTDNKGNMLFFSKECHSNGCMGTLDVTYPSIPLFLKYNPELVIAMLRPIMDYAKTDKWQFDFAPHDVGIYPLANGQVYGLEDGCMKEDMQMPVEECGNMLLCLYAAVRFGASRSFADENYALLKSWADYLVSAGYDPGNQLCTDDFAGPSAHNCNLSIKAILAIAAFGKLFDEDKYIETATKYAEKWEKDASNEKATRLSFDNENSWSLKYNIVWDKLLDINIFNPSIFEKEVSLYGEKMNKYGVPLDSRADYTKIDWLVWTTVMTDNAEYRQRVMETIYNFVCDTPDRTPMPDWYYTSVPRREFFQNRTVLGGIYINLL